MKSILIILFAGYYLLHPFTDHAPAHIRSMASPDSVFGVFAGRTPCREISNELSMPAQADCSKLKWMLTLYKDPRTSAPTTYKLACTFHRQSLIEGKWIITKGAKANARATVYQLDPDKPAVSMYLMKGDDNVLFFLDKKGNLLVGNTDFSYTLNRRK